MKLLVICGPTSSGKTKVALELAKKYHGEIISCDSRQVYIGMDIGTGKDVNAQELQNRSINVFFKNKSYKLHPYLHDGVNIWMYDVVKPNEEYSISHHLSLASAVIEDVVKRGKLPILVGGSGLYLKAITDDIATIAIPQNTKLRQELLKLSLKDLQTKLAEVAPLVWQVLNNSDKNNPRRLVRKIEIALSQDIFQHTEKEKAVNNVLTIGLTLPTSEITKRIENRVVKRLSLGLLSEIQELVNQGYSWELPALNTYGYQEWQEYFKTHEVKDQELAIQNWVRNEVNYVKKQMTWFKKQPGIIWVDVTQEKYLDTIKEQVDLWYTLGA